MAKITAKALQAIIPGRWSWRFDDDSCWWSRPLDSRDAAIAAALKAASDFDQDDLAWENLLLLVGQVRPVRGLGWHLPPEVVREVVEDSIGAFDTEIAVDHRLVIDHSGGNLPAIPAYWYGLLADYLRRWYQRARKLDNIYCVPRYASLWVVKDADGTLRATKREPKEE